MLTQRIEQRGTRIEIEGMAPSEISELVDAPVLTVRTRLFYARRELEEMLGDYAGTILLISHDRDFLDRVVNAVIVPEGGGRWAEYAGGYTDMLAQRGEDIAREATSKPAPSKPARTPAAPAPPSARRKLSFNEKYALETLPGEIAALQQTIRTAQERLADPNLYARDRKTFDAISASLVAAQAELAAAEDKWLELEILRETIDGA